MVHEIDFSFDKNAVTCKKEAPLPPVDQEETLWGEDDHLHLNL